MVLGKKVTIFDWEWGRNSAPRDGQKRPCHITFICQHFNISPEQVVLRGEVL